MSESPSPYASNSPCCPGMDEEEGGGMAGAGGGSSFFYLDDEGELIPPQQESSWLMDHRMLLHTGDILSESDRQQQDALMQQEETPFTQDQAEFEKERNSASIRLEQALMLERAEDEKQEVNHDSHFADEEVETDSENDDVMMGARSFSRAMTADEDEWILERILRRRAIRKACRSKDKDYATFYDDFGTRSSGMMAAGWVEYLCKWRWYEEPTWEQRELLIDEGYLKECNAFDDHVLGKSTALSGKTVVATVKSVHAKQLASGMQYTPFSPSTKGYDASSSDGADPFDGPGSLRGAPDIQIHDRVMRYIQNEIHKERAPKKPSENQTDFGNSRPIEAMAGITPYDIKQWFRKDDIKALRYGTVATQKHIDAFIKTYQSLQKTHKPMVFFHGTQPQNFRSITENGFRVPQTNRDVVNGALYGLGIYAAFHPRVAMNFCYSGSTNFGGKATKRIFICVALVSPSDPKISVIRDFCVVVKDSSLIIPLLAVDICPGYTHKPHLTRRHYCAQNLMPVEKEMLTLTELRRGILPKEIKVGLTRATNQNVNAYHRVAEKLERAEELDMHAGSPSRRVVMEM
jgi:hypothetical protein